MEQIEPLIKTLRSMKPPAKAIMHIPCACGKNKKITTPGFGIYMTNYGPTLNNVCRGCESLWDDHARMVCCTCKTVVARLKPHRDPKTGFEFKKGGDYHTERCGVCHPGLKESIILEKAMYEGFKIPKDKYSID